MKFDIKVNLKDDVIWWSSWQLQLHWDEVDDDENENEAYETYAYAKWRCLRWWCFWEKECGFFHFEFISNSFQFQFSKELQKKT